MRAWILALGLACIGLAPAAAEDATELRSLVTADDSKGWEAVGRLDIGRAGFCTGALIAPDIVLTAAHCLFDPESRERLGDDQIEFRAGLRNGRASATRGARRSVIHPDFVYLGPESGDHVAEDLALIALDRPIRNTSITPFETRRHPRKGAEVQVVSYAHNRATRPALQELCHVLGRPAGTLVMSCDVDFGSSGAPVFIVEDGVPRIVSVISAKADVAGRRVALGTGLDGELLALRTELETDAPRVAAGPVIRRAGSAKAGGGAKFLRP